LCNFGQADVELFVTKENSHYQIYFSKEMDVLALKQHLYAPKGRKKHVHQNGRTMPTRISPATASRPISLRRDLLSQAVFVCI